MYSKPLKGGGSNSLYHSRVIISKDSMIIIGFMLAHLETQAYEEWAHNYAHPMGLHSFSEVIPDFQVENKCINFLGVEQNTNT